jgi:hypothetical protein
LGSGLLCLSDLSPAAALTHSNHSIKPAKAEEYSFEAETRADEGIHRIPIKVSFSALVQSAQDCEAQAAMANEPLAWFNEPRSRQPISIAYAQLQAIAVYIDQREKTNEWTSRLQAIRYCVIHDDKDGKNILVKRTQNHSPSPKWSTSPGWLLRANQPL